MTTGAGNSSRRWPGTTSSTLSRPPWKRPSGPPNSKRWLPGQQPGKEERRGTGGSESSGTTRVREEPDHGLLRRRHHPGPGNEQPHHRGPNRPERPGRPTLRHLLQVPGTPPPRPSTSGKQGRPPEQALRERRWSGVHHYPEILPRRKGRLPPGPLGPAQHRGHRR